MLKNHILCFLEVSYKAILLSETIVGIGFIGSNLWAATDKHQYSPIGFEIIFPGMIELARDLDLSLPMPEKMIHKRDVAVERSIHIYLTPTFLLTVNMSNNK